MSNGLIMMTTTTPASVLSGGALPLTTVQNIKRCNNIRPGSNSVIITSPGLYDITASDTFTGTEAGVANLKLQLNGTDVPGITASTTITTADTEVRSLSISGVVKVCCCNLPATISLINGGIAVDTSNIVLTVK